MYKYLYNCALGFDLPTSFCDDNIAAQFTFLEWKIPCTKNKSTQTAPNYWSHDAKSRVWRKLANKCTASCSANYTASCSASHTSDASHTSNARDNWNNRNNRAANHAARCSSNHTARCSSGYSAYPCSFHISVIYVCVFVVVTFSLVSPNLEIQHTVILHERNGIKDTIARSAR